MLVVVDVGDTPTVRISRRAKLLEGASYTWQGRDLWPRMFVAYSDD